MPCIVAALFFYISAKHYEEFRRQLEMDKEEAQTKASQAQFEESDSVAGYGYFKKSRDSAGFGSLAGSFKYVHMSNFGVVRNAASS